MITRELQATLLGALQEARKRRHEYLCLEHLLYLLSKEETGGRILRACAVNLGQLQKDLPEFGRKTPLKRAGQPVELSGLYVFLASQESSFITAEVFGVTGGMHLA